MCLAIPGKIAEIKGMKAIIDYGTERRTAIITKDVPASVGDFVLVQMGCVVQKLTDKEAEESSKAWKRARQE
ncbi:HypC/HybG/HupF family hydrogenase formation chaperone [Candidatus Woesearchaeota archaeon]|nr:HypC/HybG/HupF family hydrogenase formation chaperone [Candidatus Woesearchaeota archaeon]